MDQFFWGLSNTHHTEETKQDSSKALTKQVDRLTLACQAMWEIVRDQTNITEKDLTDKISEIDLRDGVEDGKMGVQVIECSGCGRNSNSRRKSCVWCGEGIEGGHVFEA